MKATKTKPLVIPIFNVQCLEVSVNPCGMIDYSTKLRRQLGDFSMWFFVSINKLAVDKNSVFEGSNLGKRCFQI